MIDADAAMLFEVLFLLIGIISAAAGVWAGYWAAMVMLAVLVVEQFVQAWRDR